VNKGSVNRKIQSGNRTQPENAGNNSNNTIIRESGIVILLYLCGIAFFGLAHPNIIYAKGFPFFSYFAFVPVFLLVRRLSWKFVWLAGFLYGALAYVFFGTWLAAFHPMGMVVMGGISGLYLMLVFPLLKLAAVLFTQNGWIVQWLGLDSVRIC